MRQVLGIVAIVGIASGAPAVGQSTPFGMHAIKMAVADPAKTVRFYEALGMKEGPRHGEIEWELGWAEPAHGSFIYLIHDPQRRVPMPPPGASFVMISVPDMAAAMTRLRQAGFSNLPEPRVPPRAAIAMLTDPDGNTVQVLSPVSSVPGGAPTPPPVTTPPLPRLGLVNIHTTDLDRSTRFYTDVLGLKMTTSNQRERVFALGDPRATRLEIELTPMHSGNSGFSVLVADVDAVVSRTAAAGGVVVRPAGAPAFNYRTAVITDPDGTTIEVLQPTAPR